MESLKGKVIRLFLEFVSHFVPIGESQFATLGGQGLEAKIWQESGIPPNHGWLIERNRERGGKLITNHRYRTQNQLGTFDRILAGYGDKHAFIDAFHLDLCGTLSNSTITSFAPALPLILMSKGRCLAITVADARRNLILEQWPDFEKRALKLFGKNAESIYKALLAKQRSIPINENAPAFIKPFDPEKATRRELGLLVELAELLKVQKLPWIPVTMERYVYVSRYQKRPFRMRTYFFRFEHETREADVIAFAKSWIESKLLFANGENFLEVKGPSIGVVPKPKKMEKGERLMPNSKLGELAKLLGGAEEAEYSELLTKSRQLDAFLTALKGAGVANIENQRTVTSSSASEAGQSTRRIKKNWKDLSDREQIEWQIKALELKASSNGHWQNGTWKELIRKDFGHYDQKLSKSLRAALARTSGGFREMFKARIETVLGNEAGPYLDRLGKLM